MTCAEFGKNVTVEPGATVGYEYDADVGPAVVLGDATIRRGTTVYADVELGRGVRTGHDAIVREHSILGADVALGSKVVLDGYVTLGANVSVQPRAYVAAETDVGDDVFVGPNVTMTTDPSPLQTDVALEGPTIEDGASIGANATILPDVTVGENAFVAPGAVVAADVPAESMAVGAPATPRPLPEKPASGSLFA